MDLVFHPKSAKDAQDIAAAYTRISEPLVERFWADLDAAIDLIASDPKRHHFDLSGLRRSNLKSFPYHILFEEILGCVQIIVIRHHRRHPAYGLRRK